MNEQQTKQKRRQLMTILHRMGIDDDTRHEMVYAWTKGRTKSTTQLTFNELNDLVWKLNNDATMRNAKANIELQVKQKRSVVLAIAQRCGIHGGTDFEAFNSFMLKRSVYKKSLYKYDLSELEDLIKQFRSLEQNYKQSASKFGTRAYNHAHGWANINEN